MKRSNRRRPTRRLESRALAAAQLQAQEYADTIRDIYDQVQKAGTARSELRAALDYIASLCVGAVSDLDSDGRIDGVEGE